ncbi:hypothetical protein GCM10023094_02390 [Rhodococcus olei]|uniref:Carrier domain-containing protein n=1 Tax=Rhodococcus olei TaxID=2161675 RepID=A0ABP8NRY4_9NOCA
MHNLYGPTEAAVDVTFHEVTVADEVSVPIGAPVWNTRVFVLDARLRPVPVGVPGELYLAGVQLARGYVGRVDLTSDRFVANPFAAGERMYRTGDLVAWNRDGELEYLGRTDFQVKLRGLRIELGEIEAALLAHDAVAQAVAVLRHDDRIGEALVAYLVGAGDVDLDSLTASLRVSLPAYMVPSAFVVLGAFPVNASGKLDRRALPAPVFEAREFRAPSTPVEELVADIFAEVLGVERVGADDDFFELGGNSLIATQVAARIGATLATEIPVRTLFEASTVAALAVVAATDAGRGGRSPLVAGPRPERIPLSLAQSRMWFLSRFDTASAANNIPVAVRLTGDLDVHALQSAVTDVLARHEILRTVYPEHDGAGHQLILPTADVRLDLSPVPVSADSLLARATAFVTEGFDVAAEVPLRATLFRVDTGSDAADHVLVFVVHHIAADGFSVAPLVRDVMVAYSARHVGVAPGWQPLPVQYADYTLWQRDVLGSEDDPESLISRQLGYWTGTLAGLPEQLDLPADRQRPAVATNRGAAIGFDLDAAQHSAIGDVARAHGATPFMVVHAALAVLLARLSSTDDIAIGAPIAGRGDAALDDLVGMFVNTLVLRTRVDAADTFSDLLARVREADLGAFSHADVPFERLVEVLNPARSQARHPLFQVALFFQNLTSPHLELDGLNVSGVDFDETIATFDLQVTFAERQDETGAATGMAVHLGYATDLFDEATVRGFGDRFLRILTAVTARADTVVGDIDLLDEMERDRALVEWNDTAHELTAGDLLLDAYAAQVAANPDATAVVYEGDSLTYAEFDGRVNRLARRLIDEGVGPESLVALAIRRSLDLVVAIYAVVRAGGAYVPVDPDHPVERIGHILDTADPTCVLTTRRDGFAGAGTRKVLHLDDLDLSAYADTTVTDGDRIASLRPEHPAYVIFTSGSTGKPKGVAVSHRAIANQIAWMLAEYPLDATDVYLQKTATTFDVSLWGWFMPLRAGATLVVATPDGHRDPAYVAERIAAHAVTVTDFVPSMLTVFAGSVAREDLVSLRRIFVIGEALPAETVRDFARISDATVHNLYGPTEAAVSITFADVTATATRGGAVTIGRPQWNSRVHVLDSRLRPVPVGVPGELYLAGVQLARGYHGRFDLTSDRFVANPFTAGERMYRTGDLVRWTGEGELDYLGRTDFQVKFRGQRIELGEIETALLAHESVLQAAVLVVAAAGGDHLVGYVVPTPATRPDPDDLVAFASRSLPGYMVPSAVVLLDAFPLNASGKLDRKALPAPVFTAREFRAPTAGTELAVAAAFAEALGHEHVGLDDDFFALGGNSLVAMQVVARLGAALDTRIAVRELFEAPTVGALAALLDGRESERRVALVAGPRPERIPLSAAQNRMWFLNRFDPESAVNNIPVAVRLTGALDAATLQAAVADVIARHEVLRTVYPEVDGAGHQVVLPEFVLDLTPEPVAQERIRERVAAVVTAGFDVTATVPVRGALLRIGADDHVLVLVVHHIAGDLFSVGPLTRDLLTAYVARSAGQAPAWVPLPVQYADYALWQRRLLGSEDAPASTAARQLAHWSTTLDGLPDQLDLPTDRPRPAIASNRGASIRFDLDSDLHRALSDLAREHNSTLFMVLHAALALLLARMSGTSDIAIGTPIAGRGERELDDLVGMFVNTLVLRTEVDGSEPFGVLLARARETDLQAFAHADVPFERLVEVLDPVRSQARNPLFQVALVFQNVGPVAFELPGLNLSGIEFDEQVAKFDLQLTIAESVDEVGTAKGITAELNYATDLFDRDTAVTLTERLTRILRAVAADSTVPVGAIDLLGETERAGLIARHGALAVEPIPLGRMMANAAALNPSAPAVVFDGVETSYAELDRRSSRIARHLIARGLGAEDLVAVAVPRSDLSVLAAWAVAKTGAAFAAVDPNYPVERVRHMVTDAGAVVGLTVAAFAADLPDVTEWLAIDSPEFGELTVGLGDGPIGEAELVRPVHPAHPAYVIFTSGSTGLPKGVVVTHSGLANFSEEQRQRYRLSADTRALHVASPSFDASILELLLAIGAGGALVVAPPTVFGGVELADLIRRERVTHSFITPSALASVDPSGLDDFRVVVAGGEAVPGDLVARWAPGRELYNGYGPTETTIMTNISAPMRAGERVVIGGPTRGMRSLILDDRLQPVPVGVVGELYIAGIQLARGYRNRSALTSERFVANPHSETGERMYRTGDVVRWTSDGDVEYVGRSDFQVKIRGLRIELGEIDAVLAAHDDVEFATTVGHDTAPGRTALVSYVLPAPGRTVDPAALTAFVAESLAGYMVPAAIVVLDEIPLTPVGKLDRKALPEPVFAAREFRAPSTPTEEVVAGVFAEVLGASQVGADDDFFALGGNSLIATQVAARLGAALDTRVPVRELFEASTVAALAARLEQLAGSGGQIALVAGERPEHLPLSLAQQRMWFLNRFDPESAAYNIPAAIRLTGALDIGALQAAVADVVARHEVLRTVYPETASGPAQVILPAGEATVNLDPVSVPAEEVGAAITEFVVSGFDVTVQVPIRTLLVRVEGSLEPVEHVLTLVVHHIAADGSSMGPFTRDLMAAYAARTVGAAPSWEPLPVQYADYALWQRSVLGGEDDPDSLMSTQLGFWKSALAGLPDQLDLPTDRPRPAVQSYHGGKIDFAVGEPVHRGLADLARDGNATLFMVVHAAFTTLLARLSGMRDIAVGTPFAGRGDAALDDLIGMFVNTLVFRTDVDADLSFTALLGQVRERDLAVFAHADVPFESVVEALNPARSTARHPLCQVGLSFQNLGTARFELDGLTIASVETDVEISQFDLHLIIGDHYDEDGTPRGLSASLTYATALFDRSTAEAFADRFLRLLEAIVANPAAAVGDLPMLESAEYDRIVGDWNATDEVVPGTSLVDLFDAQVARTPDAVALVYEGESLTYAEFDTLVNRLARKLIADGVGPETLVGLAVRRSIELLVGMYAVVKAGGAYVPIDPDHPADRIALILDSAAPALVLTRSADAVELPGDTTVLAIDSVDLTEVDGGSVTDADRRAPLRTGNPAYVIFTSGSTGRPKGVAVSHAAVVNQMVWKQAEYGLGAEDAVLLKTAATFDLSVWEFWWALQTGARLVIARPDGHQDPRYLLDLMTQESVTTVHVVPSMLSMLLADPRGTFPGSVTRVLAIGEALPAETAARLRAVSAARLDNLYGPTEAAVSVTSYCTRDTDTVTVPIGAPEWNTQVFVLDSRLHPVPVGVAGELYLAGAQLARGYHGRSDLTADRFVANPFGTGARMYRTGDVVRWRADGNLEYLERADFQVKVRGFRIELGEIESALRTRPGVTDAVVVAKTDAIGGTQLVGYVVGDGLDGATVRAAVAGQVPSYMVPAVMMVLDRMPLNVNGKVERTALPEPEFAVVPFRAPTTPVERIVATTIGDLVGADRVGLDDNFFELGGNSLVATQVVARIGAEVGAEVPLLWVFADPTVAGLAARIEAAQAGSLGLDGDRALQMLLPIREEGSKPPLFCVHPIVGLSWAFAGLSAHLDPDRPIYGLQSPVVSGSAPMPASIEDWAELYVDEIRSVQPVGPYQLIGWSLGGVIAHAMAVRLQSEGDEVELLAMMDSVADLGGRASEAAGTISARDLLGGLMPEVGGVTDDVEVTPESLEQLVAGLPAPLNELGSERVEAAFAAAVSSLRLIADYRPEPFKGDLVYFAALEDDPTGRVGAATWRSAIAGAIEVHGLPTTHWHMASAPALQSIAEVVTAAWTDGSRAGGR